MGIFQLFCISSLRIKILNFKSITTQLVLDSHVLLDQETLSFQSYDELLKVVLKILRLHLRVKKKCCVILRLLA